MDRAVLDSKRAHRARWLRSVSPAAAHAIRMGVAASAAIWIGKAPGLVENSPTWILITVIILVQPTIGGALSKGLARLVGTVAGAFTAILLFGLFAQDPPLLMTSFFLVQVIAAYGNSGQTLPYAWFVWAFTTAIVLVGAMGGDSAVETVAFQRTSMVAIGILLVLLVESLLWPARAEAKLRQSLAARARGLGVSLSHALLAAVDPDREESASLEPGSESLEAQLTLVDTARSELVAERRRVEGLARIAVLLEIVASISREIAVRPEVAGPRVEPDPGIASASSVLAAQTADAFTRIADALAADDRSNHAPSTLDETLLAFELERDRLSERVGWRAELERRASLLHQAVSIVHSIEEIVSSGDATSAPSSYRSWLWTGFDPFRVRVALRTGIATTAAILITFALGWPLNGLVVPVAFIIAGLTRGAAAQVLMVFVTCVMLGWALADLLIVHAIPHAGRMPVALMLPFAITSAMAWAAAKNPKLAALPVLGGLIALLPVYGGQAPPTNVYGSYSTVTYMILALAVGWVSGAVFWPATSASLFRQRVASQLGQCLEAVRLSREPDDEGRHERIAALVGSFAGQMAPLGRLHAQASFEPVEQALDPPRRARILSLTTNLMDTIVGHRRYGLETPFARGDDRLSPLAAAIQREDTALAESMGSAISMLWGDAAARTEGLAEAQQEVARCIDALRTSPESLPPLSVDERRRSLAELAWRRRLVFCQLAIERWLEDWQVPPRSSP